MPKHRSKKRKARTKIKNSRKGSLKSISHKLDTVNSKLAAIQQTESRIEKEEKTVETKEAQIQKTEQQIQKEEQKIENVLFQIGKFTFKRAHLMVLIKGTAGSFLGVGLGRMLLNMEELANKLPWLNLVGILFFILIISGLLLYKSEKDLIKQKGLKVVWTRLAALYAIALLVELIALGLFMGIPASNIALIKVLIIGSYAAMAGAVSFSLT